MNSSYFTTRTTCRLCGSADMAKVVPLAALPVASPNVGRAGLVHETAPADVWQCDACGHLQLATIVNPEFQYRNFQYFTGISLGLREHFGRLIDGLAERGDIGADKFVIDIGSNDGSLLRLVQAKGAKVLGIDPAEKIAKAATDAGIPTLAEFFDKTLAAKIAAEHGKANVVISNNTVANIDELDGFFAGIDSVLAEDGIIVVETQYALDMIEKTLLDVVYHEHISYFATKPTQSFFAARGYELVSAERIAPKGGSIRFIAQRVGGSRKVDANVAELIKAETDAGFYDGRLFDDFNDRIAQLGRTIRERLETARRETGRALAFGASVGCAALIHYFDLGDTIDAIFDDTPLTNEVRTAEGSIPVLSGSQLMNETPSDVVVLAWRYASPIARNHADFREAGGRFFRALPDSEYVDGSDMTPPAA